MKNLIIVIAMALFLGWGQAAMATLLNIAGDRNGSNVEISNFDAGLSVIFDRSFWGMGENSSISASLVGNIDDQKRDLAVGASWEVDFFTLQLTGSGVGSFDINATLAFDEPDIIGPDFTGNGDWGTKTTLQGAYSAGALWWEDPVQALTLSDGNILQIALEQGFVIGKGNDYTLSATITNLGSVASVASFGGGNDQPAPVPEPATLLLFGTGIVGLASLRRRPKKR